MKFVNALGQEYTPSNWLAFNDVLLQPLYSELNSRNDPRITLKTRVGNHYLDCPIISSNMDTVTGSEMAIKLHKHGGLGLLHRFFPSTDDMIDEIKKVSIHCNGTVGFSIGCKQGDAEKAIMFYDIIKNTMQENSHCFICIDVAHGHMKQSIDTLMYLRKYFDENEDSSRVTLIAGNVASVDGFYDLSVAGADAIRVGIGCGSICTTRIVTGHGTPQLSTIMMIKQFSEKNNIKTSIIADGGIRQSGDIVKALAAGADAVMLGSLLSGTEESPGETHNSGGVRYKIYRGQSSRSFLNDINRKDVAPEGEAFRVSFKGSVENILNELKGGIRSGMTYSGSTSIEMLREKAVFLEISQQGYIESTAHAGLNHSKID